MALKTSDPEATLRKGNLPPASKTETVKVQSGVARRCVLQQDGGNANPKHRTSGNWGIGKRSTEDAATLNNLSETE